MCIAVVCIMIMMNVFQWSNGCRVSARFYLLVFDVNQGNKEAGWDQDFFYGSRDGMTLLISSAIKNIECALEVGCAGVWNS